MIVERLDAAHRPDAPAPWEPQRVLAPSRRLRSWVARRIRQWVPPLVLLGLILVITEIVVRVMAVQEFVAPRPSRVLSVFVSDWSYFWYHLRATLNVMIAGTAIAFVISFALAMVMAQSRYLSRGLFSVLVVLKLVPTVAVAPLMIIWFGFGMRTQVIVVMFVTFFPMVVNFSSGLTVVDPDMVTLLRSQGANRRQLLTKLRVPHSLGYVFTGLRTALPLSAIGAIVGEWVGASRGIGYIVKLDSSLLRTAHVFGALLAIALAGMVLFGLVVLAESVVRRNVPPP